MPNTGNFKVSLWNYSTQELIATTTVNVTDITQFKYNDISPVEITANVRYVISIFLTSGYAYSKKPGIPIYPFTIGSITFEDFRTKNSPTSVFPDNFDNYITLGGVPDFQFEY